MAAWTNTPVSAIEDDVRIDAEYYHPENKLLAYELDLFHTIPLGRFAFITDGQHGYFKLDQNSNIRHITARHIEQGLISRDEADRLSIETHNKNLRSSLCENDILITTAGTIGRIGFVTNDIPPANIDQDLARVAIYNSTIQPLFLWVYLQTRFGHFQIKRSTTGQVQQHLSLAKTRKLRVPEVEWQNLIVELARSAIENHYLAKKNYEQAQTLLEFELGLDQLTLNWPYTYVTEFSEVATSHRFDASHYRPRYAQLITHIQSGQWTRLGAIAEKNLRGVQPSYVADGEVDVVNSQHIGRQHLDYENFTKTTPAEFAASPEAGIQYGDILIYSTGAYVGRTNVYLRETPALASNHVHIIRVRGDIDPAYLAMVLSSPVGAFQTEKHARGSAQAELYPLDIAKFIVPLIDRVKQKAIGDLVRKSLKAQDESKRLLEQARRRVEELIEESITA